MPPNPCSFIPTPALHEPPLDMFGADAVERWFTEKEVGEMVEFIMKLFRLTKVAITPLPCKCLENKPFLQFIALGN